MQSVYVWVGWEVAGRVRRLWLVELRPVGAPHTVELFGHRATSVQLRASWYVVW